MLVLAAVLVAGPWSTGGAGAQTPTGAPRFDIPAQPLAEALARFATSSGVDIAYGQRLAADQRSSPVQGVYPAPAALRMLLEGTGLAARFTGPRAAIIYQPGAADAPGPRRGASAAPALRLDMAEVRAPIMIGARDRGDHQRFALAVQSEVRELLRMGGAYQGRDLRLEIRLTIDRDGVIREVAVRRASGESVWDRQVVAALTGRALSASPPADLVEPLVFEIMSERLGVRQQPREGR